MAQETDSLIVEDVLLPVDTAFISADTIIAIDTITSTDTIPEIIYLDKSDSLYIARSIKTEFKPDPTKAVIYAAIFPGLGQIYNRKYWKLPIVYGGFLGCAYAITWNGDMYNGYRDAYNSFQYKVDENGKITNEFVGDEWKDYFGKNGDEINSGNWSRYNSILKRKRDFYRRYRDLSYIITVGVYIICIIDAYVDAQLFDFDISPDLSMKVEPVLYKKTHFNTTSVGVQCSFNF